MKALVTGASGHLGYHICKRLTAEGYQVRAFMRSSSYKDHLSRLGVDIFLGNILDAASLKSALKEVEVVFHTAAIYTLTEALDYPQQIQGNPIMRTALEGTKNLYETARERKIRKIVYTSSVETVGLTYDQRTLLDESHYAQEAFYVYSVAKIEAEKLALDLAHQYALPTVVCNPSTIVGKDDYKPTPSNAMLLQFVKFSPFFVEGGQSLVDVEDVAQGHVNALTKGQEGQRYILSGENIAIRELILLIRKIMHLRGPLIRLNKMSLYPAACVLELWSKLTQQKPFLTRRKVLRSVGSYSYYDCAKARQELGYAPKRLAETLPATLRWLTKRYL